PVVVAAHAELERLLPVSPRLERQRLEEAIAESDIDDEGTIDRHDEHEVTVVGARTPVPPPHGSGDIAHVEAERLEHPAERAVHLVAPPATPVVDQLRERRVPIEWNRSPEVDVEVLVRHGHE